MIQVRFILHILTIFNEMHSSFVFPLYLPTCLPEARACSITIHLFTYSSVYMGPGRRNSASLCHLKYDILKIWSPNMKLWDRIHVSLSFCGCIYFNLCPYFVKPQATFPPPLTVASLLHHSQYCMCAKFQVMEHFDSLLRDGRKVFSPILFHSVGGHKLFV